MVNSLSKLYAKVPKMKCKEGCNECCECWHCGPLEYQNILNFLKEHNMEEKHVKNSLDPCPYIVDGKCSIYPVRPLICRLYGVVFHKNLRCPYVKPKRMLTFKKSKELFAELAQLEKREVK